MDEKTSINYIATLMVLFKKSWDPYLNAELGFRGIPLKKISQ